MVGDPPVPGGGKPEGGRCLWAGLSFFIIFSLSSSLLTPPFPGYPGALGSHALLVLGCWQRQCRKHHFLGSQESKGKGRHLMVEQQAVRRCLVLLFLLVYGLGWRFGGATGWGVRGEVGEEGNPPLLLTRQLPSSPPQGSQSFLTAVGLLSK